APGYFPRVWGEKNLAIFIVGKGSSKPFSIIATDCLPDRHLSNNGQGFYLYDNSVSDQQELLLSHSNVNESFKERLNITDIEAFYYVYAILHNKDYVTEYSNDLNKDLPRIPLIKNYKEYISYGQKLVKLHLNYEDIEPYTDLKIELKSETPSYRVEKMRIPKYRNTQKKLVEDLSTIHFNKD